MKIREHFKRFARRYVQLLAAVLYNCNWKGFAEGRIWQGKSKGLCVPGLNCYSCPSAVAACPLGSIQTALISSRYKIPYYLLGTVLLMGLLLGRMICGFLCPFGFLQELLYKIPSPKLKKSRVTRGLSWIKYGVLVIFVILIPIVSFAPGFCKYICPVGTLEAGIPLTALQENLRKLVGGLFSWKVFLMALIVLGCVFAYRAFCRFLCPLGAIYSFFQPMAFFGISVDETKCTHCGSCVRNCKMDIQRVCDRECIQCGECIDKCPANAIHYGALKNRRNPQRIIIGSILFITAIVLITWGLMHGGFKDVMSKAIRICYECMGIG